MAQLAPCRPAVVTGSGSCTKDCEYFRNEILKEICDILFDRTEPAPPFPIPNVANRAQSMVRWKVTSCSKDMAYAVR